MTTPLFSVRTSPAFERVFKKLLKYHPDLRDRFAEAIAILRADPYNRTKRYPIKKLAGSGDQYRLRLRRWRFIYDIREQTVELHYCSLRREDTYT